MASRALLIPHSGAAFPLARTRKASGFRLLPQGVEAVRHLIPRASGSRRSRVVHPKLREHVRQDLAELLHLSRSFPSCRPLDGFKPIEKDSQGRGNLTQGRGYRTQGGGQHV